MEAGAEASPTERTLDRGGASAPAPDDGPREEIMLATLTTLPPPDYAMPERANNDIALVNGGHASRCQLELVVASLVIEHAHGDETHRHRLLLVVEDGCDRLATAAWLFADSDH